MTNVETPDTPEPEREWLTLREASTRTGRSVSGLRKAVKRDALPSRYDDAGRLIVPVDELERLVSEEHEHGGAQPRSSAPPVPADMLLVPRDAWQRTLDQLGNLADLATQLADARERAAKAETEASFLRDRLAEQRRTDIERIASEHAEAVAPKRRRWFRRS